MLFSSIPFLFYFLPLVLFLYCIAPRFLKNSVLLIVSLLFYFWGEPKYTILMLTSITISYITGILVEKYRGKPISKLFLWIGVGASVFFLAFFKYADFFIDNINAVFGVSIPLLKLALPIGISFYTFQSLSYVIDVYRGNVPAQKNYINLATYVVLFPQLIAGPIVRYTDINEDLEHRTHSMEKVSAGAFRFTVGLAKKILIADQLGELCDIFRSSGSPSVLFYWMYAISAALQIYFDFSGYSDMAIGLGKIFGFRFLENFNYPYISKSITEFWRRWHMSLGSWFRDYIYIPMGGNRCSTLKWLFNIFVVWMFTGFWHGAAWNFVIWGLYFAFFLIIEKLWLGKVLQKLPSFLSRIYLLFMVLISFVIFSAPTMGGILTDLGGMFGTLDIPLANSETLYFLRSYAVVFILAVIGATPIVKLLATKFAESEKTKKIANVLTAPVMLVLLVLVTAYLVDGSFSPFLYFRF